MEGTTVTGKTVVLKNKGVHLVLTDYPPVTYFPNFFTSIGLDLWKADIVVAKNLFPFRFRFLLYNRRTFDVASAGTSNIDVFSLDYHNISRPIYPLDEISSWQWKQW